MCWHRSCTAWHECVGIGMNVLVFPRRIRLGTKSALPCPGPQGESLVLSQECFTYLIYSFILVVQFIFTVQRPGHEVHQTSAGDNHTLPCERVNPKCLRILVTPGFEFRPRTVGLRLTQLSTLPPVLVLQRVRGGNLGNINCGNPMSHWPCVPG